MRLFAVSFLVLCTAAATLGLKTLLPAERNELPQLIKRELPPPPFKVEKNVKRTLQPGFQSLTQPPLNEFAHVGDTVTLVCRAHAPPPTTRVLWYEFASTGTGQVISDNNNVLPSHPNFARYRIVQPDAMTFILEISNVIYQDGGSYACADIQSGPPEVYSGQAELVVLVSNPNCTTVVPVGGIVLEGQNYTKSCQINFRGGLAPTMYWTGPEPYLKADIILPTEVFSGIAFTIDRGMDTRAYSCRTNFTTPISAPPGTASNAPSYEYMFQFGQLFVYWAPKNMFAVPMKPEYAVGDQITCYADAFPAAFYAWQNMDTVDVVNDQVFTVTPNMVGRNSTLRCQAQNLIQGFLYAQNLFIFAYVPAPTTPTTPTTTPTTTTPLPEGYCSDLTGWWLSNDPYAELYLLVRPDQSGQVVGFMRNGTDQQWVELFGRTRISDFNFLGLTAIWPYDIGITGMAGECHRCFGVEKLMTAGIWRSSTDSLFCGNGGNPTPHTTYEFYRITVGLPGQASGESSDFKAKHPTELFNGKLGLRHVIAQSA